MMGMILYFDPSGSLTAKAVREVINYKVKIHCVEDFGQVVLVRTSRRSPRREYTFLFLRNSIFPLINKYPSWNLDYFILISRSA